MIGYMKCPFCLGHHGKKAISEMVRRKEKSNRHNNPSDVPVHQYISEKFSDLEKNYLAPIRTDINSIEKSISSMKTYWKIFVGIVITAGSSCIIYYLVSLIVLLTGQK